MLRSIRLLRVGPLGPDPPQPKRDTNRLAALGHLKPNEHRPRHGRA